MKRQILFFEKQNGSCPAMDFIDSLSLKVKQKVISVLDLVEMLPVIPGKFFKKLVGTDGIWEIRIEFSSNIYRIFCFMERQNIIVLTHGFQKKTQKTPNKEIALAEKYKEEYFERRRSQ